MEPRDPRVKAALAHMRETENVKELNAMVFRGESSIESWGATAMQNRLYRSLDVRELEDLRARVNGIETKLIQRESAGEAQEINRIALAQLGARVSSLEASQSAIQNRSQEWHAPNRSIVEVSNDSVFGLSQRLATAEVRIETNERLSAEALRESKNNGKEDLRYHLQACCARLEARLSTLEGSRQRELIVQPPPLVPRQSDHEIAQIVGLRAALDEIRSLVHRQHADIDELRMNNDALRDRVARTEEQVLALRAQLDTSGSALERRAEQVESNAGDERERLARLETRLNATESKHDDFSLEQNTKIDAMTADLAFVREHNARLEELFSSFRFGFHPGGEHAADDCIVQRNISPSFKTHFSDDDAPPAFYDDDDDDDDTSEEPPRVDTGLNTTPH